MHPSDMDYRDQVYGIPEDELIQRGLELRRKQAWTDFCDFLKAEATKEMTVHGGNGWHIVVTNASTAIALDTGAYTPYDDALCRELFHDYLSFAEFCGWPAVFGAIGRAMDEQRQERERLRTQG